MTGVIFLKYAVMSDIHCNLTIFNILIDDALKQGVTNFLFLGDYVTDGTRGNEVFDIIKQHNGHAVLGNREKYIKTFQKNIKEFNSKLNNSALCYDSLSADSLRYINSLHELEFININGQKLLMLHGDGFDFENMDIRLFYDKLIQEYDFDICLFGHTHTRILNIYKNKTFINPGSVGQPLDGNGFSYCILEIYDGKQPSVQYKTINIDRKILNFIKQDWIDSKFYENNVEWCELIMASISNSFNYVSLFMEYFNNSINAKEHLTNERYKEIFRERYREFSKKYNINNFII